MTNYQWAMINGQFKPGSFRKELIEDRGFLLDDRTLVIAY